jgi:hypothetical protein
MAPASEFAVIRAELICATFCLSSLDFQSDDSPPTTSKLLVLGRINCLQSPVTLIPALLRMRSLATVRFGTGGIGLHRISVHKPLVCLDESKTKVVRSHRCS